MNIYITSDIWKDTEDNDIKLRQFSIHHDIEMNCEDSTFFCAHHVIDLVRDISVLLSSEDCETFYNMIKENLQHGN